VFPTKTRKEKNKWVVGKRSCYYPWWQCCQNMIFTKRSQNKKERVMEVMLILERR
jgi:hypothetical protein